MKDKYLDFIKEFSKITIKNICEQNNVDRSCLLSGRTSEEKTKKVYDELTKIIKNLDDKSSDINIKKYSLDNMFKEELSLLDDLHL